MVVYLISFLQKNKNTTARKSKQKPEKSVPENVMLISIPVLSKDSLVMPKLLVSGAGE